MVPALAGFGVSLILLGLSCLLVYRLMLQNGRLLLRLEALEQRAEQAAGHAGDFWPGLPAGSVVHDFELPDLAGERMTLSQWRGRRVLLIFFDPCCGFCRAMLPDLAGLSSDPSGARPVLLLLTTGDRAENQRLIGEHDVRCPVLLQDDREVASLYRVDGTPMGYLVDERGRTGGPLAVGAEALLALARAEPAALAGLAGPEAAADEDERLRHLVTRSPRERRRNRSGLAAGTLAPSFQLPRLGGGELSLEAYRGRRVLLVFSDPTCGVCDRLAPQLELLHRRVSGAQIVMVSRRGADANRAKAAEHGLTFPIVLQRHWEISQAYGMLATPIGYLIGEDGVLAADVAVGAEAILVVASAATG